MKLSIRQIAKNEFTIDVSGSKTLTAKLMPEIDAYIDALAKESKKTKSEIIRNAMKIIIDNDIYLNAVPFYQRKTLLSVKVDYRFYQRILQYCDKYNITVSDFVSRTVWWILSHAVKRVK